MTTIKGREPALYKTLESLSRQSLPNGVEMNVQIWLSQTPYLLDVGFQDTDIKLLVPAAFSDLAQINIVENYGPYRKLLPVLQRIGVNAQDIIITADDDTAYPPDWITGLLSAHAHHDCVIGWRGHAMAHDRHRWLPYEQWIETQPQPGPSMFNIPTGKDGVLYQPDMLHEAVTDVKRAMSLAPTGDDLWFKWHTAARGVPSHILTSDYRGQDFTDLSGETQSLWRVYNEGGGNDAAIARLDAYAQLSLGFSFFPEPKLLMLE